MERKKDLEVCLVIVTGLVVLFLVKGWTLTLNIAVLTGITGIFSSKAASWLSIGWYKIADVLGTFTSKIILTVIYYLFLFPVALLFRIFGQNKNAGIKARNAPSLWIDRGARIYSASDLKNPW
jgi:hypothetical protein